MKTSKNSCDGFTLTEVMVAMLVLGIGLGSAVLALSAAMQWVRMNRIREFALHMNRDALETISGSSMNTLSNMAGTGSAPHETNTTCGTSVVVSRDVTRISPVGEPLKAYMIATTATWADPYNTNHTLSSTLNTIATSTLRK